MSADTPAVDFAAIMADGLRSAAADGRTIQQPGHAARSALATKVPELCSTCHGTEMVFDLRCDNCGGSASLPLGMTCPNHLAKPTPCPDCPTIGQLLAIGAEVMGLRTNFFSVFGPDRGRQTWYEAPMLLLHLQGCQASLGDGRIPWSTQ